METLSSRNDLSCLVEEMLGEMVISHLKVDPPGDEDHVKVGLLGADYRVQNDRYRFARVYKERTGTRKRERR